MKRKKKLTHLDDVALALYEDIFDDDNVRALCPGGCEGALNIAFEHILNIIKHHMQEYRRD